MGRGRGLEDVECATLEWVAWYNGSRVLELLGYVPPTEFEKAYHDRQAAPAGSPRTRGGSRTRELSFLAVSYTP